MVGPPRLLMYAAPQSGVHESCPSTATPSFTPRYVRSNAYEAQWVFDNLMGPRPLWLMESLCEVMALEPGIRVLDLGCGTALTSIFLAREFSVQVWATDWWIDASDNHKRIVAAGVEDLVTPIHAEAHGLPFERGFFDAIVSVDAYHYFGTSDLLSGLHVRPLASRWSGSALWSQVYLPSSEQMCPIISSRTGNGSSALSTPRAGGERIGRRRRRSAWT